MPGRIVLRESLKKSIEMYRIKDDSYMVGSPKLFRSAPVQHVPGLLLVLDSNGRGTGKGTMIFHCTFFYY